MPALEPPQQQMSRPGGAEADAWACRVSGYIKDAGAPLWVLLKLGVGEASLSDNLVYFRYLLGTGVRFLPVQQHGAEERVDRAETCASTQASASGAPHSATNTQTESWGTLGSCILQALSTRRKLKG